MKLVDQELLTLTGQMCSPLIFSGVHVVRVLVFYVVFCRTLWFVLFRLSIVLYLLLRFMDSDYHFGIFNLFLNMPEILLLNEEGPTINQSFENALMLRYNN